MYARYEGSASGLVGTVAVTILAADGSTYAARTTTGITEPVAGSGVYAVADPDPDLTLTFVWDEGAGGLGTSETLYAGRGSTASDVADAVRTDLTPELAHLDADVSDAVAAPAAALAAAGVAGDPWTAEVPGDYEEGTAGALLPNLQGALTTLGARAVTIASPVAESGTVTLCAGDDYAAADGRAVTFAVAVEDVPSLTGATLKLKCAEATWTATGATSDGTDWSIVFEPTAAQTAALTAERLAYKVEATLAGGNVLTLATGTLVVMRDIPEVV